MSDCYPVGSWVEPVSCPRKTVPKSYTPKLNFPACRARAFHPLLVSYVIFFQRDETEDLLNEELLSVKSRLGVLEKNLFDERKRERNALSENDTLCLRLEEYGSKMKSVLYENTGLKTQIEELKAHLEEAMQNIEYLSAQVIVEHFPVLFR